MAHFYFTCIIILFITSAFLVRNGHAVLDKSRKARRSDESTTQGRWTLEDPVPTDSNGDIDMDPELAMARTMIQEGHQAGQALLQQFAASSELESIFTKPEHVRRLLDGVPFFKALKGIEDIEQKAVKDITSEDGLILLETMRNFLSKTTEKMQEVSEPSSFAKMMKKYVNLDGDDGDGKIGELMKKVQEQKEGGEGGGRRSMMELQEEGNPMLELQQAILNKEMGDVIDLSKLGFDGTEPDFIQDMRQKMLSDPGLGRWITEDPHMAKFILDGVQLASFLPQ